MPKQNRSSKTGKFVTKRFAESHTATTQSSKVVKGKPTVIVVPEKKVDIVIKLLKQLIKLHVKPIGLHIRGNDLIKTLRRK